MTDTAPLPKLTKREMKRLREIERGCSLHPAICPATTSRLVERGFAVKRDEHPPRWSHYVQITPAGRAVLESSR